MQLAFRTLPPAQFCNIKCRYRCGCDAALPSYLPLHWAAVALSKSLSRPPGDNSNRPPPSPFNPQRPEPRLHGHRCHCACAQDAWRWPARGGRQAAGPRLQDGWVCRGPAGGRGGTQGVRARLGVLRLQSAFCKACKQMLPAGSCPCRSSFPAYCWYPTAPSPPASHLLTPPNREP